MTTISAKQLHDQTYAIVDRAKAGEDFTIQRNGKDAATLKGVAAPPPPPPPAGKMLFAPDSIWRQPIGGSVAYTTNSRQIVDTLHARWVQSVYCAFQGEGWSTDFYINETAIPRVHVDHRGSNWSAGDGQGAGDGLQYALNDRGGVPLPSNWQSDITRGTGTDGHVAIWDKPTDTLYDFWVMQMYNGIPSCGTGGVMQNVSTHRGYHQDGDYVMVSNGVTAAGKTYNHGTLNSGTTLTGSTHTWSAVAASFPNIAGTILLSEMQQAMSDQLATGDGVIPHALTHDTPEYWGGWTWPAQRTDGTLADSPGTNQYYMPAGGRLVIQPGVTINSLTYPGGNANQNAALRVICRTLQTYGSYQRDRSGGALAFWFESGRSKSPSLTDSQIASQYFGGVNFTTLIRAFPWANMEVMAMGCKPDGGSCVRRRSGSYQPQTLACPGSLS